MPVTIREKIKSFIKLNGSISLENFMEIALFDNNNGYYNTNKIIGQKGDFITSPEINQIFSEMILTNIYSQWESLGKPKNFSIIDLGPGKGSMMKDILLKSSFSKEFSDGINPILYEKSKILKNVQKSNLGEFNCHWVENINQFPKIPSFIIANEFFDSLPINQFISFNGDWYDHSIFYGNGKFYFDIGKKTKLINFKPAKDGVIKEISFQSKRIFSDLVNFIIKHGSSILIIDYGQTEENFINGNTVQAIRKHESTDIFKDIGNTDISSWVNFSIFKKISEDKLNSFGPISQKAFLYNLGIRERLEFIAKNKTPNQRRSLLQDFERLVSENHMGQLFKVFGLSEKKLKNFPGF